ncbi:MAG: hypothetical protein RBR68_14190 [Tenuifilaceae bacterium]|nr:hypothetical protein [Tenuifilaceae bacterium]
MEIIIGIVCLVFGWVAKDKYDALMKKQAESATETEEERLRRERIEAQFGNLFDYNETIAMGGKK